MHTIKEFPHPCGYSLLLDAEWECLTLRVELSPKTSCPARDISHPLPFASEYSHVIHSCRLSVSKASMCKLRARQLRDACAFSALSPASAGCRPRGELSGNWQQCEQEVNFSHATRKCWGLFVTVAGVGVIECSVKNTVSEWQVFQADLLRRSSSHLQILGEQGSYGTHFLIPS